MKKNILLLSLILIISCQYSVTIKNSIESYIVKIKIKNGNFENDYYHIYFKNTSNESYSKGLVLKYDQIDDISTRLSSGIYMVYIYGLSRKSSDTKQVFSYLVLNDYKVFKNKNEELELIKFEPIYNYITETKKLHVNFNSNLFSISSARIYMDEASIKPNFIEKDDNSGYYTKIQLNGNAIYMNISFSLKGEKDKKLLEKQGIKISTTRFEDINLTSL